MAVRGRRSGGIRARETRCGYAFISPWLLGFFIFVLGPMLASLWLSFCRYNPAEVQSSVRWVGLDNYARMFTDDPLFWTSLFVTLRYAVISIPLQIAAGLAVALLLNQPVRGIALYRTCFYLPMVLGGVATSLIWMWLFSPSQGLLNAGLSHFYAAVGADTWLAQAVAWVVTGLFGAMPENPMLPAWTTQADGALNSLILMSLWGVGGSMIINLAGLQSIPKIFYEAAEIDGAGPVRRFFQITLPLLSPTIFFNLVMGIIGSFQVFTQGFIMTEGGPNHSTHFYVLYTYENAFEFFRMGYASALAWVLFVIILALTALVFRSSSAWVHYEAQKR